jgi:hypothetical protein
VVELSPEVFGLTTHASTPATAARRGVELAQAYCAQRERGFDIVRSEIWPNEYRIAFRCPRISADPMAEALAAPAQALLPPPPEPGPATARNRRGVPSSPGLF